MDAEHIKILMETLGWIGAISLLMAYLLISNGKTIGKSYLYQGLNLIGSGGLIVNSYYHNALPSVILNIIWVLIGLFTLRTLIKQKENKNNE